jgi:zinc transport system ATP-binding protein
MNPIEVEGLCVLYGAEPALRDIAWTAAPGDFWAIVGPNGSGKSTLLKAVLGLLRVHAGRVRLFGSAPARFVDWRRVGYLPQFSGPAFPHFPATVREIVALGRLAGKRFPRLRGRADAAAVDAALAQFGVADLAARPIGELSGGQQQRALLARAIVNQPDLLLLDEPNAALDPDSREEFYRLLQQLHVSTETTIVLVTHDSATAGRYADHLLYLDRTVVFSGTFEDFCHSPAMADRFGAHAQHTICHQHPAPEQRP